MTQTQWRTPDDIRADFSAAMSHMYRTEVPLYGELLDIVHSVNAATLQRTPELAARLKAAGEADRLDSERHGAIRVGTAAELAMLRRAFAVMGMAPVGYYDLSLAGVPVHATAFRPTTQAALNRNPFRVFTSLVRLELIEDEDLRRRSAELLSDRQIFTAGAIELIALFERQGGLGDADAARFVAEILETFRWHGDARVDAATYDRLHAAHRLIADVVSFRGPHINHLTPRTLDIDAAQAEMLARGIRAKAVIEGPPRRAVPILLRQTSFTALQETVRFSGNETAGTHSARFGEIEQRGAALTPAGRELYDRLLAAARGGDGSQASDYPARLADAFGAFPDDEDALREQKLAYFHYSATGKAAPVGDRGDTADLSGLLAAGAVQATPIVYEDFLPVSAAGIFQSNLGGGEQKAYSGAAAQEAFEQALGAPVADPFALYAQMEQASVSAVLAQVRGAAGGSGG
ncbi:VOC family protein [Sphingomonas aracearum]|uniref:2-oxoadipate dioxygenase/decarboxylase n=2 Tax=Sphingomonas aracearum TaxID=2283317 RepID=A0A369W2G1_9SPHN|nr:VOC family protein [Sphingomonas aracearum]